MQRVRSHRTVVVLVLLLGCLARSGFAASGKDAKKIYEEATAAFGLGRYAEAAEKYEAAFAARPDPALLYNAAQAFRLAGNKARALELYRNYVRLFPDGSNANDARSHVAALKKDLEGPPPAAPVAPRPAPLVRPAPAPATTPVTPLSPAMPPPVETLPPAPATVPAAATPAPAPGNGVPMLTSSGAPADAPQPLTKKVWFWVVVGAGAVLLTTVVLLATRSETFPDPTFGTATGN
jgi:hypothetical protein